VTEIGPVLALSGTVAVISVPVGSTVKAALLLLLNFTAVAPRRFAPVIVTDEPAGPLVGVNPVMVGGATTVKSVALVATPSGVVTVIGPVVTPAGTVALMRMPFTE
jgi:hypothetical protein